MEAMFLALNARQEQRLEELIKAMVDRFNPLQILCFGSKVETNAAYSCFFRDKELDRCSFDLLTITEDGVDAGPEMQAFSNLIYKNGSVKVLHLTIGTVKAAIEGGDVFVNTILKDGVVLFVREGQDGNYLQQFKT